MKNKKYLISGILILLVISIVYSQIVTDEVDIRLDFKEGDLSFTTNKDGLIKINTPTSKDIYLGFAITGKVNNQVHLVTIEDYNWTWDKVSYNVTRRRVNITRLEEAQIINPDTDITEDMIDNITFILTNLTATNNNSQLVWKQQYSFDPEGSPKLSHTITNNIGKNITEATFWFVFKLPNNFRIIYNNNKYNVSNLGNIRIRNTDLNLTKVLPIIDLEEIEFIYADLIKDKFIISDFYIGNGSIVGHPETLIGAIGVTKGNSILVNGQTIILDPEITDWKSPTRTGMFYDQWTNGVNLKTSNNQYATASTSGLIEGTDLYGFDAIPANSTILGIEIRVEAEVRPIDCVE